MQYLLFIAISTMNLPPFFLYHFLYRLHPVGKSFLSCTVSIQLPLYANSIQHTTLLAHTNYFFLINVINSNKNRKNIPIKKGKYQKNKIILFQRENRCCCLITKLFSGLLCWRNQVFLFCCKISLFKIKICKFFTFFLCQSNSLILC